MPHACRQLLLPIATILLLLSIVSRADEPPPSPLVPRPSAADLAPLLKQLDADTRAERLAAEKKLIELGPAILPQLPAPELLPSAAVRDAVARVRNELELRQARDSVQPSRVTAKGTKSLPEWLKEISKQTGNAIDAGRLREETRQQQLTLEFDRVPFWQAIEQIKSQLHPDVLVKIDDATGALRFDQPRFPSPAPVRRETVVVAGAFRATFEKLDLTPIPRTAPRRLLRGMLRIVPEPRLWPLFLQYDMVNAVAITPAGKLAPYNPLAKYDLPFRYPGRMALLQLDYQHPKTDDPETIDLHVKLSVTVAAGRESIRFTNVKQIATGKDALIARRRGGVTVTLQRATLTNDAQHGDQLHARVAVAYDAGGPAFESHRSWMLHNQVSLETPDGKRLECNGGYETTLQADGTIGIEYHFRNLPPAADFNFVYVVPTLIIDVPVEVELKWQR